MQLKHLTPRDLALFVRALPLARRAQAVRRVPVADVIDDLAKTRPGLTAYPVHRLARAAERASARWASWFGGMNTCLVRSLVLGALLADRDRVVLNVGFRSPDETEPEIAGHAWLTVDGRPVGRDGVLAEGTYTRVLEMPYCVSGGGSIESVSAT